MGYKIDMLLYEGMTVELIWGMNGKTTDFLPKKQTALRILNSLYLPRTAMLVEFLQKNQNEFKEL